MMRITRLADSDPEFENRFTQLLSGNETLDPELTATVSAILDNVRDNGVTALVEYTNRLDHRRIGPDDLEVTDAALQQALTAVPDDTLRALEHAAARIRDYHQHQKGHSWSLPGPGGFDTGSADYTPGQGRYLRSRRQGRLSVVGIDECDTG